MKKLARFSLLVFVFAVLFVGFYSIIPTIVLIFGGSFTAVAQSVPYSLIGSILILVTLGAIFSICFNEDFYTKD
jgi:hypothetical protein